MILNSLENIPHFIDFEENYPNQPPPLHPPVDPIHTFRLNFFKINFNIIPSSILCTYLSGLLTSICQLAFRHPSSCHASSLSNHICIHPSLLLLAVVTSHVCLPRCAIQFLCYRLSFLLGILISEDRTDTLSRNVGK